MNPIKRIISLIVLMPLFHIAGFSPATAVDARTSCRGGGACSSNISVAGDTATVTGNCSGVIQAGPENFKLTNMCPPFPIFSNSNFTSYSVLFQKCPGTTATFQFTVTLSEGTVCTIDPSIAALIINTGHMAVQSFNDIRKAEHFIDVANGEPGLKQLTIRINGKPYKKLNLYDGSNGTKSIELDAATVMTEEKNTLTFTGRGDVGSFANILVGDTPFAVKGSLGLSRAEKVEWGRPPVDSVEDNTFDQSASAPNQQIRLNLTTSLDLNSARSAYHYQVTVKGSPVSGFLVAANPSTDGTTLVLTLPTGSFAAGDAIQVNWKDLKNSKGQLLSGHVDLIVE